MQRETKQIYEFGPFRIDTTEKLLLKAGETVPLMPKNIDLLLALVENHGRVLEKEALMKMVWPDTFVEEINLSKGVFLLRKTLGDGYIETLPKRGYRFIAETHTASEEEAVIEVSVSRETIEEAPRSYWKMARVLAAVVTFAIASWLLFRGGAKPKISSLVVLPFVNLSSSPEDEYLSDGITEELINALTGIDGLRVVARTSAFRFKGKPVDVREVGRILNADGVIEGSVRRDQSRIRVTVQFNSARDGYHYWSQTFDRENAGIFAVQDEIAQAVARSVGQDGGTRPVKRTARIGTRNLDAYNLYLRGEYLRQRLGASMDQAFTLFQQAIALDPSFAAPWAGVATTYHLWAVRGYRYPKYVYPQAIKAAQRALALDPNLASAHALMGTIHLVYNRDWMSSKRELDTAATLDPDDAETHHALSHYWVSVGNFKLAHEESLRAQSCDPLNVSIAAHQAFELEEAGHYPEAVAASEQAVRLDPRHTGALYYMEVAYEWWGKLQDAIATRRRAGLNDPPPDALERALAEKGPSGYWRLLAEAAELRHRKLPTAEIGLARMYTFLGQTDRALDWLRQGIENRDPFIVNMKYEPPFAAMRNDPRFIALVKAAGIP